MSISSQPRAGDVRALLGAITLGSGMGLAIGAAYLVGGLDRVSGVKTAPAVAPAMEATVASVPPNGQPAALRNPSALVLSKPAASTPAAPAPGRFALAVGALRQRFHIVAPGPLAARPYHFAASADEAGLNCLTQAVYFEARGESQAGQEAVAQVVLNRVRHPAFPKTICGVVHQRSAAGCQFTFACKNLAAESVDDEAWRRARKVASGALHGVVMAGVGEATHFQTARSGPFAGLLKVAQIGAHVFYRFSGHAGSDAMFHQTPGPSRGATVATADLKDASKVSAGRMVMASLIPSTGQIIYGYATPAATAAAQADHAAAQPPAAASASSAAAKPAVAPPPPPPPVTDKAA
ncbi:MAG: cell wall hydrolase [Caulobacteraceae bacterium]